ncbi:GbsR/MarR family transcriptional regulator [Streptomyces sp. AC495_CC817]|uniref:GbsR/MarR family transcriptional regulator n=1 Tax=Streptomyces sp. AC495_CC817 TaxID=2823900 RepID=UPI001C264149|nr:helix-turn-helix domain-containing protein [Streptomyces sp. AC495_CC817]
MEHRGQEAAEQAAAMMTAAGMPRMPARVMMALVAAPDGGYTAAELSERLGVSAAAVSGAVRYLQDAHFVRRLPTAGHRRDRYDLAHDGFHSVIIGNIPVYLRLAEHVDRIGAEVSDEPASADRAAQMSGFLRFMAERMPQLVAEWEAQSR